jgi:hypothetical protein
MPKIGVTINTIYFGIYEHSYHTSIPNFGTYIGLLVSILDLGKLSMLMRILDFGIYIYIYEYFHSCLSHA